MAKSSKKKKAEPTRAGRLLGRKNTALKKKDIGPGGHIFQDANMTFFRGVTLPSLALMHLVGATALRDSSVILIDGAPASSKSSLAIEFLNWAKIYGGTGIYIDAENKTAIDIAAGTLNDIHLYHPSHRIQFHSNTILEDIQKLVGGQIAQCAEANKDLTRDMHIPFFAIIDPLAQAICEENVKRTAGNAGATDRGTSSRTEALLWTQWVKWLNTAVADLPFTTILVNHFKDSTEQRGSISIARTNNPGGKVQNYQATVHLRCEKVMGRSKVSADPSKPSYETIKIQLRKNSRGASGRVIFVRKYIIPDETGRAKFIWDWDRATAELLASEGFGMLSSAGSICNVVKKSEEKFNCKLYGMTDVSPSEIGKKIHADPALVAKLMSAMCLARVKEYERVTDEELALMEEEAQEVKAQGEAARESDG